MNLWTVEDFFNDYFDYFDNLLKRRILRDLIIKKPKYRQLCFISQPNNIDSVYLVSLNDNNYSKYFILKQYKLTNYMSIEEIKRLALFTNIPFYIKYINIM